MKRVGYLFDELISDENIEKAIHIVNASHRSSHGKKNQTVKWVEETIYDRIKELRQIILDGFVPTEVTPRKRWDVSAQKWREICEPKLYPDQYIHHILIQVLEPIMMRGMDHWCCGSIKGRGISYGIDGISKWFTFDKKNCKYAAELDIYHFYQSIQPKYVIKRMGHLVKDEKVLDLIWAIIKNGISLGCFCSQWFANVLLQPLDQLIRDQVGVKHYIRYMDNITLFGCNKNQLHKARRIIAKWLKEHGLKLKSNWQVFPVAKRAVNALGYRFFANGKTAVRKRTLLRFKRKLKKARKCKENHKYFKYKDACGLLSRLAAIFHASCYKICKDLELKGLKETLRNTVSRYAKKKADEEKRKNAITYTIGGCYKGKYYVYKYTVY